VEQHAVNWRPPRKQRPRDEWGRFRSQADIRAEQEAARRESLRVGIEEQYWIAQEKAEYDDDHWV
jgi:hypothetical protein